MNGFFNYKNPVRMHFRNKKFNIQTLRFLLSVLFTCMILCNNQIIAQNITQVEYFLNSDPGYGNATQVSITPSSNIQNQSFSIDISGLEKGFHYLYLRSKDENGKWSTTNNYAFYKENSHIAFADIVKAEYFFNTDPGIGNGVNIPVTASQNITGTSFIIDISSLERGFHNLYIRTEDENNLWSLTNVRAFYIDIFQPSLADIVKAEYFFNTDPGFGNGVNIPITACQNITGASFIVDISSLETGFHNLYIRAKAENNLWSLTNVRAFYKDIFQPSLADIVKAEYFFNIDPGIGNGIDIPLSAGSQIDGINFNADISSLENGFNHLYIRAKDSSGKWSLTNIKSIYKEIIDNSIADIIEAEYFFNLDPGFGNGTPISISEGSNINVLAAASLSELSTQGVNRLFIRTKDSKGKWSHANIVEFTIDNLVELIASPAEGGTVSGGGWYENNYELTVSANPNEGYYFVSWTEGGVYVTNQKSFTYIVNNHRTLTANFESFVVLIGDVNGDGFVNVLDAVRLISHLLGNTPIGFIIENADINGDAFINVADLTALINLVLEITK